MTRRLAAILTTLAVLFGASNLAAAPIWAPMSDEALVKGSELIVVGRIVWIENGEVSANSTDTARILVDEVLKGDPGTVLAPLDFPGANRGTRSWWGNFESTRSEKDIYFELNQEGIWFLARKSGSDAYCINNPARFKPLFFKDKVLRAISQYN